MADRDLKFTITAEDKASKVIEEIAEASEALEDDVEVAVDVDGADTSQRALEDIETVAERLDGASPSVTVDADDSGALDKLDEIERKAAALDQEIIDIAVDLDATGATGGIDDLTRKADGAKTGLSNTFRDITGPLGDTGVISEWGEAFEGAAGIAQGALGNVGLDVGNLATTLGAGGLAFGAALAFWDMFQGGADEAKKSLEETIKIQEQIAAGQIAAASAAATKKYAEEIRILADAGFEVGDAMAFIMGAQTEGAKAVGEWAEKNEKAFLTFESKKVTDAADEFKKANLTLEESQRVAFETAKALGGMTSTFLDQARDAVPAVRDEILTYIAALNGIPPSKLVEIRADANPDDVGQVEEELNTMARDRETTVDALANTDGFDKTMSDIEQAKYKATVDVLARWNFGKAGPFVELPPGVSLGSAPAAATVTNVNVTQHIRNGIGTDRFAVERAVRKANLKLDRLKGIRP